jgi:hypothetical protein
MKDDIIRSAVITPKGRFRYQLKRSGICDSTNTMVFIMLNPSTADGREDDPTIRRCMHYAKREGCGRLTVVNLFAARSTNPDLLDCFIDPIGSENDRYIREALEEADIRVAAWGAWHDTGGLMQRRLRAAAEAFCYWDFVCLGKSRSGQPAHPLYKRNDQPFTPWSFDDIFTGDIDHA